MKISSIVISALCLTAVDAKNNDAVVIDLTINKSLGTKKLGTVVKSEFLDAYYAAIMKATPVIVHLDYYLDNEAWTPVKASFRINTANVFEYKDEKKSERVYTGLGIVSRPESGFAVHCPSSKKKKTCYVINFNPGFSWVPYPQGPFLECKDRCGCYPAKATAEVEGKGTTTMDELKIGDKVLAANNKYQTVYTFGHYSRSSTIDFTQLYLKGRKDPLELSFNHLLYKHGETDPVWADLIEIGDKLIDADKDEPLEVYKIVRKVPREGFYMPMTMDGTIVVNGILTSAYVSIHQKSPHVHLLGLKIMNLHQLQHIWATPLRVAYNWVSPALWQPDEAPGCFFHPYLLWGRDLLYVAVKNKLLFAVVWSLCFSVLIPLYLLESAPILVAGLVLCCVVVRCERNKIKSNKIKAD